MNFAIYLFGALDIVIVETISRNSKIVNENSYRLREGDK